MVQVAFQQADYVAWNVWSAINGRPLLPFKYQHLGDMMSLGKAALPLLKGAGTMLPLAAWTSLLLLLQVAPQEQSLCLSLCQKAWLPHFSQGRWALYWEPQASGGGTCCFAAIPVLHVAIRRLVSH